MLVKCLINDLSEVTDSVVAERLQRSIHIDGPITDLVVGRIFSVQAIEVRRDRGLWLYLHSVEISPHPYPYPSEFFQFIDSATPKDWRVGRKNDGEFILTFASWADDVGFYERLVDGDKKAEGQYAESRAY